MSVDTLVSSLADLGEFSIAVRDKALVTLDIEGVELSRMGTIELISIGIELDNNLVRTFIFDASSTSSGSSIYAAQIAVLKEVLESPDVVKIIHDCRQDSDALSAHLNIQLVNVFDTVVWNAVFNKSEELMNLNNTLEAFGCAINENRDPTKNIYKDNPNFWATRPVTAHMIAYAAGDVSVLFELYRKMTQRAAEDPELRVLAETKSQAALGAFRDCTFHEVVEVPLDDIKRVCGQKGKNIRKIEEETGGWLTNRRDVGFLIFAKSESQLAEVRHQVIKCTTAYRDAERERKRIAEEARLLAMQQNSKHKSQQKKGKTDNKDTTRRKGRK